MYDEFCYIVFGLACLIGTIIILACVHTDYSLEKQKIAVEHGYFKTRKALTTGDYYERWSKK